MRIGNYLVTICFLLLQRRSKGSVEFTFEIISYSNPLRLDVNSNTCEFFYFLGDGCDPEFTLTIYITSATGRKSLAIREKAGPFYNHLDIVNVMQVTGMQKSYPFIMDFELNIEDYDLISNDVIARFSAKLLFSAVGVYQLEMGDKVRVKILLASLCSENYYGQQCDVYCRPEDGVWMCDGDTGERICLDPTKVDDNEIPYCKSTFSSPLSSP
ncbi:unnamed protein product [Dicrocoelium dendriticum]|nr:unnamed protein product [Dicrocoelium dendriticum]